MTSFPQPRDLPRTASRACRSRKPTLSTSLLNLGCSQSSSRDYGRPMYFMIRISRGAATCSFTPVRMVMVSSSKSSNGAGATTATVHGMRPTGQPHRSDCRPRQCCSVPGLPRRGEDGRAWTACLRTHRVRGLDSDRPTKKNTPARAIGTMSEEVPTTDEIVCVAAKAGAGSRCCLF
jgi:hypothetical protein